MTEDRSRIINVIRKLQALSTSSNEHEAALAAAKAAEMLQQHNLSLADIEEANAEKDEPMEMETWEVGGGKGQAQYRWKVKLFFDLAHYNFCRAYHVDTGWTSETHARHRMILVGKAHNREVVLFLYDLLTRQLEAWSKKYPVRNETAEAVFADRDRFNVWGPRKSFLFGAVQEISKRLYQQWMAFQYPNGRNNDKALVVVRNEVALLDQFEKGQFGKLKSYDAKENPAIVLDPYGYGEGQKAGRNIGFQAGVGGRQIGARALGSGEKR